jgi:Flp pilus assembly protein TadG
VSAIKRHARAPDNVREERGSAVVEFVVLAVLMLIPLVYLVMMLARVQAGSYAVSQAAREAGRAYVTADVGELAGARAEAAARIAFLDHSFETTGGLTIACDGSPCLRPDGHVQTTATVRVPLPLVPSFVREVIPLSVPVSASHLSTVDRFRGLP